MRRLSMAPRTSRRRSTPWSVRDLRPDRGPNLHRNTVLRVYETADGLSGSRSARASFYAEFVRLLGPRPGPTRMPSWAGVPVAVTPTEIECPGGGR